MNRPVRVLPVVGAVGPAATAVAAAAVGVGGGSAATPQATGPRLSTALGVRVKVAGEQMVGQDVELVATDQPEEDRPVYERLPGEALEGDDQLFASEDTIEAERQVVVTDQERRAARARLLREARLAARVDHTGTVRVYDVAEETGDPWIVMEALPGRTLQAALRDDGPLPVSQVTSLGLRLLEALAAIHRAGIVHRDVKPGNVQLCGGQRVVLTDFGIASTIEGGAGASSGGMVGSPGYVAPEQVHGGRVEPASDLFSLGATLYAAVEGRSPFAKGCPVATLTAVVDDPPAPLVRAGPLGPVIQGLLAKDPARRLGPDQARAALQATTGNHLATVSGQRGGP